MAGEPELTGLAKHFNSVTFTGRANVAKVGGSSCEGKIIIHHWHSISRQLTEPSC